MGLGLFPPLLYLRKCRNKRRSGPFRYLSQTRWCLVLHSDQQGSRHGASQLLTAPTQDAMQLASPASILFSTLLLLRIAEATPSTEGENVTSSSTDPTTGQLKMTPTALTVQYKTSQTTAAPPGAQTSEEVTTANPKANVSTTSASEESVSYSTGTVEQLEGHVPKTIGTATTGSDETTHTAVHHHTAFSVPGTSEPEGTKQPVQTSDKRVLWCLAPVLAIVVAALAYAFKSKLCKSPMYPDTTENGTENASYQSRPENSKDGVMLLGVKSGGEDNAAAR